MNSEEFAKLKGALADLSPNQRRQIKDQIHAVEQQQTVHLILEYRVAEHPVCPHCGGDIAFMFISMNTGMTCDRSFHDNKYSPACQRLEIAGQ